MRAGRNQSDRLVRANLLQLGLSRGGIKAILDSESQNHVRCLTPLGALAAVGKYLRRATTAAKAAERE